jgi:hypothetical protein
VGKQIALGRKSEDFLYVMCVHFYSPLKVKSICLESQDSSVDTGLDYRLQMAKELGFDSVQGQEMFIFSTASRPALGPTQLPNIFV